MLITLTSPPFATSQCFGRQYGGEGTSKFSLTGPLFSVQGCIRKYGHSGLPFKYFNFKFSHSGLLFKFINSKFYCFVVLNYSCLSFPFLCFFAKKKKKLYSSCKPGVIPITQSQFKFNVIQNVSHRCIKMSRFPLANLPPHTRYLS